MTYRETIRWVAKALQARYGDGESQAIGRLVADYLAGEPRNGSDPQLTEEKKGLLPHLLKRLEAGEPVQYVLGEAWFSGLRLEVDNRVLIPRPETEELVEWVISHCRFPLDELTILDAGTGSGCIAIALKRRLRRASVWAIDSSAGALDLARKNALRLGTPVEFIEMDMRDPAAWDNLPPFDFMVSNPPYIPMAQKAVMDPHVKDHEPHEALFVPDEDPLLFYRILGQQALRKLRPGGRLFTEIHYDQAAAVMQLYSGMGFVTECRRDLQQKDRLVSAGLP